MDILMQPRERKTIRMTASVAGFLEVSRAQVRLDTDAAGTFGGHSVLLFSHVHVTRLVSPFHEAIGRIPVEILDPIWLDVGDQLEMDLAHDGDTPQEIHLFHRPGTEPYVQSSVS
jgi:hypothetical protein